LLALLFALEHKERVGKLVLVSPPPVGSEHEASMRSRLEHAARRPEVAALLESLPLDTDETEARRARFVRKVAPSFADPRRALDLVPVDVNEDVARAAMQSLPALRLESRLTALYPLDALVIRGAEDPVPREATADLCERVGARLLTLERSGHAPFVEAENAFIEATAAFLDPIEGR
jgi:pimeloyl-ACP methyl ester carboxylesterase